MYMKEVAAMMDQPYERAKQSLFSMFRTGLINGTIIPEVQTEGEQAAHHMLGCVNYVAMMTMYATAGDMRADNVKAAMVVEHLADDHLMLLTEAVLAARGPIGVYDCQQTQESHQ